MVCLERSGVSDSWIATVHPACPEDLIEGGIVQASASQQGLGMVSSFVHELECTDDTQC